MLLTRENLNRALAFVQNDKAEAALRQHIATLEDGSDLRDILRELSARDGALQAEMSEWRRVASGLAKASTDTAAVLDSHREEATLRRQAEAMAVERGQRVVDRLLESLQSNPYVSASLAALGTLILQFLAAQQGVQMPVVLSAP